MEIVVCQWLLFFLVSFYQQQWYIFTNQKKQKRCFQLDKRANFLWEKIMVNKLRFIYQIKYWIFTVTSHFYWFSHFILFVSGSDIDSEGLSRISEALKYNSIVEDLQLQGKLYFLIWLMFWWGLNIDDEGSKIISRLLKINNNIKWLNLSSTHLFIEWMIDDSDNNIGNKGASHIFESLKSNTTIRGLDLQSIFLIDDWWFR